jgi:hypothetical protein
VACDNQPTENTISAKERQQRLGFDFAFGNFRTQVLLEKPMNRRIIFGTKFDLEAAMEGPEAAWKRVFGLRFGGIKSKIQTRYLVLVPARSAG